MLHGEIKVNGIEVGRWTAANLYSTYDEKKGYHQTRYECNLSYIDGHGYPCEAVGYLVNFRKGGGSVLLAAQVIEEGTKHARRKRTE